MRRVLVALIQWYQRVCSPLVPHCCRFAPSCSQYFLQAIEKYGCLRGSLLGAWRLLRCHPFSRGGHDPIQ
ncbi:MAG: membrane protein insertion efficiency factor YidD [Candidatus Omnitrophota bacterium]|nr:membrane protein insertion efficiency factor YidD [Candidatus Omnitrophota bacterium]MDD5538475.1 membrane protein insertion efficiency factor YidD [Candidatus Omnitrophota bacterium]